MPFLHRRLRPSFLILGTQKGGTTAFFHHLAQHPDLESSKAKEISFFNKTAIFERGTDWYHRQFPLAPIWSGKRAFEATPEYLYHPGTAERIARYAPKMKLIVMLRDPVPRAYSAWNMYCQIRVNHWPMLLELLKTQVEPVRKGMIEYCEKINEVDFTTSIRQLIANAGQNSLEPGILERGLYARQIAEYHRHFPKEQLLILESSRCRAQLNTELDRVVDFLGVKRMPWDQLPIAPAEKHERQYQAPLPEEARDLMRQYFREPNEQLFALIGERYAWNDW